MLNARIPAQRHFTKPGPVLDCLSQEMDVLFSHYIKGKIVSGAPAKEDATRSTLLSLIQSNHCTFAPADENGFRNDEELLFHMFVQLCSSSYSSEFIYSLVLQLFLLIA